MDNFFALFRRYLNGKAKGNEVYVSSWSARKGKKNLNKFVGTGTALPLLLRAKSSITMTFLTPTTSVSWTNWLC